MSMNTDQPGRETCQVIGSPIDCLTWGRALAKVRQFSESGEGHYVCICNVHSVVTARLDPRFSSVIENADMATSDGAPVAWLMRRLGVSGQQRINGPDLMWAYCKEASLRGEPIFLYGGAATTLELLKKKLLEQMPGIVIAGAYSPPFRALSPVEDTQIVDMINASGAKTVWVSLGCPKQELWMAEHRDKIKAVMIGVGAAFDYHAGVITRAPRWMRDNGFEWLHRLCSEPRRLFKRYFITNTLFVYFAMRQLLRLDR
ncbi:MULTISPECIES: WecB/TagA/CpsF family glycosyltransferase [unclassified Pseudomonas]|uniref:WecB/TagA/CpsF family glycosyltransferase n=1 Tax=unclassified Pseudomonas TaxID=196821 RepID=UPI0021BB1999|nr:MULTISPECIES: WecB/TagA/CpsF family glycosyltransferase [unclassified Pseudomonas]MCT8166643.1 WecB/TagA/CpsF family glycosyltransferase [Pseudomonas sp. HD6422]MCT8185539.1 WecB/TagA/CpsF family glycosyltransferase [Pseudomonas sp. HD6421]